MQKIRTLLQVRTILIMLTILVVLMMLTIHKRTDATNEASPNDTLNKYANSTDDTRNTNKHESYKS